jgi:hypothetical protein
VEKEDLSDASIKQGYYSSTTNNSKVEKYNYVSYSKSNKGTTMFNTVLYPLRPGEDREIKTQRLELDIEKDKASAFSAIISGNSPDSITDVEFSYYTLFDEKEKIQRNFGTYSTDGELCFIEKDVMKYIAAILRKGTNILDMHTGKYIIKSDSKISDIGIRWEENLITIESSKEDVDLKNIAIYANGNNITKVVFNKVPVTFEQNGEYVRIQ